MPSNPGAPRQQPQHDNGPAPESCPPILGSDTDGFWRRFLLALALAPPPALSDDRLFSPVAFRPEDR